MPMSPAEIDELKTMFKKAKQRDIAFGLCLGKKPEENVMCMDPKKSGEVMMRKAKAEGDTGKLTFGMASVQGKVLTLGLEGKMLPNLAKNMRVFLTKNNLKMKIVILDPEGGVLESDGEEEVDESDAKPDTSATAEEAGPAGEDDNADPMADQWSKVAAALGPLVDKFVQTETPKSAAIAKAWAGAEAAAAKGDFKTAMAVAGKVKPAIAEAPSEEASAQEAATPDAAKWGKLVGPLSALFEKAMKLNPPNRTQLNAAWMMAVEKADAGDHAAALAIAGKLKPRLDEALASGASDQASVPKDVVAFQKSRVLWVDTRKTMFTEMAKLEKAITDACSADPELADIVSSVKVLSENLSQFDDRLQNTLDEITNTAEGPERTSLKKRAVTEIREYQAALNSDFFKDVDANNGFVPVNVSGAAHASLSKIEKVLAAAA